MIVLQEAIEHVQTRLDQDEDEDEENDPCLVQRTIGIALLCAAGYFCMITRRGLID